MKKNLLLIAVVLLCGLTAFAASNTGTSTVVVTVAPEAAISVAPASLTSGATDFSSPYTGSSVITYSIRTLKTGGNGSITMYVSTDFTGAGGGSGPSAAAGDLTYTCATAAPATAGACTTAQTAPATLAGAQTVYTFGANAHGNAASANVNWSLADKPSYETDTYTATVTWTISAV